MAVVLTFLKLMYGCCLILLKMLIWCMTKVQLGSYIVQKAKKKVQLRIGCLFHAKNQNKERLEIFLTEKAKIRYSFVPNCTGGVK